MTSGRDPDDLTVVGAEAEGGGVRLSLAGLEDPRFTGSAFIDTRHGVIPGYVRPADVRVRNFSWLPGPWIGRKQAPASTAAGNPAASHNPGWPYAAPGKSGPFLRHLHRLLSRNTSHRR